jgi:hypothetical protein
MSMQDVSAGLPKRTGLTPSEQSFRKFILRRLSGLCLRASNIKEIQMRKILLALAALATVGIAVPAATSQASAKTIIAKQGGGHHGGWHRGHAKEVVIVQVVTVATTKRLASIRKAPLRGP